MIAPLIHNVIYSIFIHDFAAQDQFNLVPAISIIIKLIDIMYTCLIKHHSYTVLYCIIIEACYRKYYNG